MRGRSLTRRCTRRSPAGFAVWRPRVNSNVRLLVHALRWVLVLLLAPFGYVAAVLTSVLLTQLLRRLCPPEHVVSGLCTAAWYSGAELTVFAFATALGAALWVVLPVLAAPTHRARVAWFAFAFGAAFATWFTSQVGVGFAVPFGSALAIGAVSASLLSSRYKRAT